MARNKSKSKSNEEINIEVIKDEEDVIAKNNDHAITINYITKNDLFNGN